MATIKYITKGKTDPQMIYVRFRDGRTIDYFGSTGITVSPKNWSVAKGWIVQRAEFDKKLIVEKELRSLKSQLLDGRNARVSKGLPITRDWFDELIATWQGNAIKGTNDGIIYLIGQYKEELPNRVRGGKIGVSKGTIQNYNTTMSRLRKFETAKKKVFRAIEIDLTFHAKYLKFAEEKLGLSPNSIGRDIKHIKTVCLDAMEKGIEINEQIRSRNFSAPSEKTLFTTLNEVELEKIKAFSGSNYLENARDWLIIGCWTGCRVGDLMELTNENINVHTSGAKVIQYKQRKTGKLVNVPMHPDVETIIERLGGFPRPISSVKLNDYIKKVCKMAGLIYEIKGTRQNPKTHLKETGMFEKWQLIKSHTCRRSFATNHYNRMTNKQIMAVTGHATEKMLLAYIGETEVEHVDDFINLWESEKNEKQLMVTGA